jgi:hypothetical protein
MRCQLNLSQNIHIGIRFDLGLTQNISQTLFPLCSLRLCGLLFCGLCVSPVIFGARSLRLRLNTRRVR